MVATSPALTPRPSFNLVKLVYLLLSSFHKRHVHSKYPCLESFACCFPTVSLKADPIQQLTSCYRKTQGYPVYPVVTHSLYTNDQVEVWRNGGRARGGGRAGVSRAASPLPKVLSSPLISAIPNQVKAAHAIEEGNSGAEMVTYLFRSHASHSSG